MKPPTRKLIGGVRESHTKEYLFQILAQTMGCREISKFWVQAQQERETRARTRVFGEKGRERKKRCQPGVPMGPRRLVGVARGWAAPPTLLGPTSTPWWPLSPHSLSFLPKTHVLALVLVFLLFLSTEPWSPSTTTHLSWNLEQILSGMWLPHPSN